jgi:hypothetical protein
MPEALVEPRRDPVSTAGRLIWPLLFAFVALVPLTVAIETAMHFNGSAIDGPFQLYNAMRRIAAGFRPGVDFQFFHGFGVAYLHYPFFRLFGAGLRGSQIARELISAIAYPIVLVALFRTFVCDWRSTFCLSAIALALTLILRLTAIVFALNGMLGLRSSLPTLLPIVLFLIRDRRTRTVVTGLVLGLALFVSTEQGLAIFLTYIAVSAVAVWRRSDRRGQLLESIGALALGLATTFACLLAIGGVPGAIGALRYNLRIVPMDQYWYFGSPPNRFISSVPEGIRMAAEMWEVGLGILLGAILAGVILRRFWRTPDGELGRRHFALLMMSIYALISTASLLGVFVVVYVQPLWRIVIVLGLLEVAEWGSRRNTSGRTVARHGVPRELALLGIVTPIAMLVLVPRTIGTYLVSLPHVVKAHVFGREPWSAVGIWPQTLRDGQAIIDARRGPHGEPPTLWSTYAGWLEARNGIFHPSYDYIIHALGPDGRAAYLKTFAATSPRLVQTVMPTYTQYEAWIEKTSWDFYHELLQHYAVVGATPWSIFWERLPTEQPPLVLVGHTNVAPGAGSLTLPPVPPSPGAPVTLLEIELTYDVRNPLRALPVVGASPRYLIGIQGAVSTDPISLNPYVRTMRFPLLARAGTTPILIPRTFSLLPGASFTLHTAQVSVVPISPANLPWLMNLAEQQGLR